jgi:AraC-like DNA-binding protein
MRRPRRADAAVLVAASDRTFGPSRLRSVLMLERRFRVHLVMRDRLVYDTRFAARANGVLIPRLYFVIRGNVQIGDGEVLPAGRAYVLADTEFENVAAGAQTFRTWGEPSIVLDLQLRAEDIRSPIGIANGPVVLGEATWSAVHAMSEALAAGASIEPLVPALLDRLVMDGAIGEAVPGSIQDAPEQLARVWAGLRPLYSNHTTSASIFELKKLTGMSIRQLARDIRLLTKTFGLPGEGFRDTTKVMRLRTAAMLLSSPGATATEVAQQVGYKSLEAMGRAFRDAKLPAPSVVQEQVRFESMPAGA